MSTPPSLPDQNNDGEEQQQQPYQNHGGEQHQHQPPQQNNNGEQQHQEPLHQGDGSEQQLQQQGQQSFVIFSSTFPEPKQQMYDGHLPPSYEQATGISTSVIESACSVYATAYVTSGDAISSTPPWVYSNPPYANNSPSHRQPGESSSQLQEHYLRPSIVLNER